MLRQYSDGTTETGIGLPPIGALAYFDSFTGGLLPCIVRGHGRDEFLGRDTVRVRLTMKEPRGGYKPGETLDSPARYVVPRSAVYMRAGQYRIRSYVWPNAKPAPYICPLCGQRIDDGKPCGCGAR
jgi:hypothetical protein